MTTMREAIRENMRLARMRQGQAVGEPVNIPSMPDIRGMLVPLHEAESAAGIVRASQVEVDDNAAGMQLRNRLAMQSDVWHALREPNDADVKLFESIEEMVDSLQPTDIDFIFESLVSLMEYASPQADSLSDKDLGELKKGLCDLDWSELSGQRWVALRMALLSLFPDMVRSRLQQGNSLGFGSTASAMPTKENGEST